MFKSAGHFDFNGGIAVPSISLSEHGKADMKRIHRVRGKFAVANLLAFVERVDATIIDPNDLYRGFKYRTLHQNKRTLQAILAAFCSFRRF